MTVPELLDELPELDPVEQRILGCLLEKQRTVPASYPLSQNALRTACNQTSSRDPVVDYDDRTVLDGIARLRERGLVRPVWAGAGTRVLKYHQRLEERLGLAPEHRALLTVLLLRGPQSPGELRTRAERLHPFADRDAVDATLRAMAELSLPLVGELERQPGRQERRWAHLLGAAPQPAAGAAGEPAVDRDVVLQDGAATRDTKVRDAYERVAEAYAEQFVDELDGKPFDRWLLARVAELAGPGPIADVGCGPGQTTALLAEDGAAVTGFDIAPAMVEQARLWFPALEFETGDLRNLLRPPAAPAWAAITAWYALVHLAGSELAAALAAMARVLAPDGVLALAVHAGNAVHHVDELCGEPVDLDFVLHDQDEVLAALAAAGLTDVEWYRRGPLAAEITTERLYVLARRPPG